MLESDVENCSKNRGTLSADSGERNPKIYPVRDEKGSQRNSGTQAMRKVLVSKIQYITRASTVKLQVHLQIYAPQVSRCYNLLTLRA